MTDPQRVVAAAQRAGVTVGVAESLTGGAVCSALVSIPGASAVLRGGIVAYTVEAKNALLGVPADLLREIGPVSEQVAIAMATGVRDRLGTDIAVSTTGVAGPDPHDEQSPGTVWVGLATATGTRAHLHHLEGDRSAVREGAVAVALAALLSELE